MFFSTFKYGNLKSVFKFNTKNIDINTCKENNYSFLLITGIAKTDDLKMYLNEFSEEIIHLKYFDHHYYSKKDIQNIVRKFNSIENKNKIIITTEKDAMRIKESPELNQHEEIKSLCYYIPIEVEFLNDHQDDFDKLILRYVCKDKKPNILKIKTIN